MAGQSWALATMFKEGLIARKENVPWTIDAQYIPGFDWLRNAEIRVVKDWHKEYWLGLEASSPQALFGGNLGGQGGLSVNNKNPIETFGCNSQLDPNTTCTLDFMPDFTVKAAWDPHGGGWGHYEIFGLARGFRDRVDTVVAGAGLPITGQTQQNNLDYGFSGGGGMILPVWGDKLQLQANVLYGQGIGRYDAAQLPDVTVNPDGTLTPLTGFSIMGGITSHNAIKDLDLYAYAGENHVFNHVTFVPGQGSFGFGDGAIDNSNCTSGLITNSTSSCAAQINDVWQVTAGFWHSLYDGQLGKVVWGAQYSFTKDTTPEPGNAVTLGKACTNAAFKGQCGEKDSADMNVVMMSFRYYPKYGQLIGTQP